MNERPKSNYKTDFTSRNPELNKKKYMSRINIKKCPICFTLASIIKSIWEDLVAINLSVLSRNNKEPLFWQVIQFQVFNINVLHYKIIYISNLNPFYWINRTIFKLGNQQVPSITVTNYNVNIAKRKTRSNQNIPKPPHSGMSRLDHNGH